MGKAYNPDFRPPADSSWIRTERNAGSSTVAGRCAAPRHLTEFRYGQIRYFYMYIPVFNCGPGGPEAPRPNNLRTVLGYYHGTCTIITPCIVLHVIPCL